MQTLDIKNGKKKYPDNIHKMPVKAGYFDRCVISRRKSSGSGAQEHRKQNPFANEHMKSVESRHQEIEDEEHLDVPSVSARPFEPESGNRVPAIVLIIFGKLDPDKDGAKNHRCEKKDREHALVPHRRRIN